MAYFTPCVSFHNKHAILFVFISYSSKNLSYCVKNSPKLSQSCFGKGTLGCNYEFAARTNELCKWEYEDMWLEMLLASKQTDNKKTLKGKCRDVWMNGR